MRISYWSSDVCSSDLVGHQCMAQHHSARHFNLGGVRTAAKPGLCPGRRIADHTAHPYVYSMVLLRISRQGCYGRGLSLMDDAEHKKIGKESCRERVCQYVEYAVAAVELKKKKI